MLPVHVIALCVETSKCWAAAASAHSIRCGCAGGVVAATFHIVSSFGVSVCARLCTIFSIATLPVNLPVQFFNIVQGYDSIVARGCQEPDPSKDVVLKIDGKSVSVPQGKPKDQPAYKGSRFSNSEYLVRIHVWLQIRESLLLLI